MKIKLFGQRIEPSCRYCEYGILSNHTATVSCKKRGTVAFDYSCRSYVYAPIKRIPKRAAPLVQYHSEDFEL